MTVELRKVGQLVNRRRVIANSSHTTHFNMNEQICDGLYQLRMQLSIDQNY